MRVVNDSYELVPVDELVPHPRNPRVGNLKVIAESIRANGFYGSVVAQKSSRTIIAGYHRWRAAKEAGITEVPVTWLDVDDDAALRILLVDNRSNDAAGYDAEKLAALLSELGLSERGFEGTGYDAKAVDSLLADLSPARSDGSLLALSDVSMGEPNHECNVGEVWRLGKLHHLVVADVLTGHDLWKPLLKAESLFVPYPGPYVALSRKADTTAMVLVQPDPYIAGHVLDKWAAVRGDDTIKRRTTA